VTSVPSRHHLVGCGTLRAGAVWTAAQVVDHDTRTLGREQQCVLTSEAATGSGHYSYQTVQISHVAVSDRRNRHITPE
jgi:hypothetical protein